MVMHISRCENYHEVKVISLSSNLVKSVNTRNPVFASFQGTKLDPHYPNSDRIQNWVFEKSFKN